MYTITDIPFEFTGKCFRNLDLARVSRHVVARCSESHSKADTSDFILILSRNLPLLEDCSTRWRWVLKIKSLPLKRQFVRCTNRLHLFVACPRRTSHLLNFRLNTCFPKLSFFLTQHAIYWSWRGPNHYWEYQYRKAERGKVILFIAPGCIFLTV